MRFYHQSELGKPMMVYIQFQEVERHFTKEIEKLEKRIRSLEIKLAKTKIEELRGY